MTCSIPSTIIQISHHIHHRDFQRAFFALIKKSQPQLATITDYGPQLVHHQLTKSVQVRLLKRHENSPIRREQASRPNASVPGLPNLRQVIFPLDSKYACYKNLCASVAPHWRLSQIAAQTYFLQSNQPACHHHMQCKRNPTTNLRLRIPKFVFDIPRTTLYITRLLPEYISKVSFRLIGVVPQIPKEVSFPAPSDVIF